MVFATQRCVRVLGNLNYTECCRAKFIELKILTFPSIYILQCLLLVKANINLYRRNDQTHSHNTRNKQNLVINYNRTDKARDGANYYGIKFYNVLPDRVKALNLLKFKSVVQECLITRAFYSLEEFLESSFDDI